MRVELRHWRAFVTAAETEHFGAAAEQLGITQPALSQLIRALEAALGFRLFDRSGHRMRASPAGRDLLPQARATVQHADVAERAGEAIGRRVHRAIAIGYVGSAPFHPLFARLIQGIDAVRPAIPLRLNQSTGTAQMRHLAEQRIDLGLVRSPLPAAEQEVASLGLARERMVLACPAGGPWNAPCNAPPNAPSNAPSNAPWNAASNALGEALRDAPEVAPGDAARDARWNPLGDAPCDAPWHAGAGTALAAYASVPFILYVEQPQGGLRHLTLTACRAAGFEPRIAQTVPQIATMLCLVGAGVGVALVPETMMRFAVPGVAYRPLADVVTTELTLLYRRSDTSDAVRAALRLARRLVDKRGLSN